MRGPGVRNWDFGLFRQIQFGGTANAQIRFEVFNVMDRPRFSNPGANVSDLRLNPDGTVQNLNGFTEITGTQDGSERQMRLGIRFGW